MRELPVAAGRHTALVRGCLYGSAEAAMARLRCWRGARCVVDLLLPSRPTLTRRQARWPPPKKVRAPKSVERSRSPQTGARSVAGIWSTTPLRADRQICEADDNETQPLQRNLRRTGSASRTPLVGAPRPAERLLSNRRMEPTPSAEPRAPRREALFLVGVDS